MSGRMVRCGPHALRLATASVVATLLGAFATLPAQAAPPALAPSATPVATAASVATITATWPSDSGPALDVVVAARRMPRGTVITAGDLRRERRPIRELRRETYTPVAVGWVTRRVVQAGEVLRAPAVAPPPLVTAGQAVRFTVLQDGFTLTVDGVAPVAGSLGDTIPVRLGPRRRLFGVVTGPAQLLASGFQRIP